MNLDKYEAELMARAIHNHGEVLVNATLADSGVQLERVRRLRVLLRLGEPEANGRLPRVVTKYARIATSASNHHLRQSVAKALPDATTGQL